MLVLILRSAHVEDVRQIQTCVRASRRPHPEERACRKTSANSGGTYARLEGLILRSAHAEKLPQTPEARTRVSKDEAEQVHSPSCFETHRSATMLGRRRARSRRDAPQHEGRGRTAHFGEAKPMGSMPA